MENINNNLPLKQSQYKKQVEIDNNQKPKGNEPQQQVNEQNTSTSETEAFQERGSKLQNVQEYTAMQARISLRNKTKGVAKTGTSNNTPDTTDSSTTQTESSIKPKVAKRGKPVSFAVPQIDVHTQNITTEEETQSQNEKATETKLNGIFPASTVGLASLYQFLGDVMVAAGDNLQAVPIIGNGIGAALIEGGTSVIGQASAAIATLTEQQAKDSVILETTDGATYLLGTVLNGAFRLTPLGLAMWIGGNYTIERLQAVAQEMRNLNKEIVLAHFAGTRDLSVLEKPDSENENEENYDDDIIDDIDPEH